MNILCLFSLWFFACIAGIESLTCDGKPEVDFRSVLSVTQISIRRLGNLCFDPIYGDRYSLFSEVVHNVAICLAEGRDFNHIFNPIANNHLKIAPKQLRSRVARRLADATNIYTLPDESNTVCARIGECECNEMLRKYVNLKQPGFAQLLESLESYILIDNSDARTALGRLVNFRPLKFLEGAKGIIKKVAVNLAKIVQPLFKGQRLCVVKSDLKKKRWYPSSIEYDF